MESIFYLFIALLLAVTATIVRFFGGEMLISGYNTSSPEEQAYMKEKGIGKFMGNYLYTLAAVILAGGLSDYLGIPYAQDISWIVFVVVIVIMLIRARRFNPPGPPSRRKRRSVWISLLILIVVGAIVAWNALPSGINLQEDQMVISGAYQTSFKYSDIKQVQLENEPLRLEMRTNGISMGPINKGHYKLKDGSSALLFLRRSAPPYIHIQFKSERKPIFINLADPQATTLLFEDLSRRVD